MAASVANITERGVRRRRLGGWIWLAIAIIAFVVMRMTGAPRPYRLTLFVAFLLSAFGFVQARSKTCVALAAVGKQEVESGGTCPIGAGDRDAIRRQSVNVYVQSAIAAIIATAIAWFI